MVALFAFLPALIFLSDEGCYTLPILVAAVRPWPVRAGDWGAVQAGVTVMIPCILLFLILQRHDVRGLTAGTVR